MRNGSVDASHLDIIFVDSSSVKPVEDLNNIKEPS